MFAGKIEVDTYGRGAKEKKSPTAMPTACPLVEQVLAGRRRVKRQKTMKSQSSSYLVSRGSGNMMPRLSGIILKNLTSLIERASGRSSERAGRRADGRGSSL